MLPIIKLKRSQWIIFMVPTSIKYSTTVGEETKTAWVGIKFGIRTNSTLPAVFPWWNTHGKCVSYLQEAPVSQGFSQRGGWWISEVPPQMIQGGISPST
jgi:hypothetical protein